MAPSKEFMSKISRLEAVERRWLWAVFSSIILGAILLALAVAHLDLTAFTNREAIQLPPTQFLVFVIGPTIILASNISVLIEYFAFELRIERAVVIKKRKRTRADDSEEEAESSDAVKARTWRST